MKPGRLFTALSVAVALSIPIVIAMRSHIRPSALFGFGSPFIHATAFGLWLLELFARSVRVTLLASGIGIKLRIRDSLLAHATADAAGAVTPSRAGSDPAKLASFRRSGIDLGRGGAVLLGEAVSEAIALSIVIGLLTTIAGKAGRVALGALPYAATTLVLATVALFAGRWFNSATFRRLTIRLNTGRRRRLQCAILRFLRSVRLFSRMTPVLASGIVFTALVHIGARIMLLPALVWSLKPDASIGELLAWPLMLLYAGALVPAPSGGGAIELGFAAGLRDSLPPAVLPAVLLWWRIYTFYLGAMFGAFAIFVQSRRVGHE